MRRTLAPFPLQRKSNPAPSLRLQGEAVKNVQAPTRSSMHERLGCRTCSSHGHHGTKVPEKASGTFLLHDVQQSLTNTFASHAASLQGEASLYHLAMRSRLDHGLKRCIECRQNAVHSGRYRSPGTEFSHAPMEQP